MSPHYGVDVQGGLAELGDIPTDYLEVCRSKCDS
jgi:hypothetical protein